VPVSPKNDNLEDEMTESRVRHNPWAILVATLASFVLAAAWYSVLLQPWLRGINRTLESLKATGVPEYVPYLVALVMAAVMAIAISCVTQLAGRQTLGGGMKTGALLWLGFIFTSLAIEYTYEVRPRLFAINAGYWLLSCVVMGAIIGAWKKKVPAAQSADHSAAVAAK
jgi:Protein of unknown function (DUF1761)